MLKRLILTLTTVLVLFLTIGFFLPNEYRVEKSVVIGADRQALYDVVGTLETWPEWTAWSREFDPQCKWTFEGAKTGTGAVMRWVGDPERLRSGEIHVVAATPERGVDYECVYNDRGFRTTGSILFFDDPAGVRVVWSNLGAFGSRPFGGWVKVMIGSIVERTTSSDFKTGLDRLKQRLEGAKAPEPAK
ncbi:MAG: SRPBCC family protein [Planctomycetes bacterium]|nr:SRPBCC family protein [Planctomycetota bacterium]